jgi:hypothetical protein
MDPSVLAQLQQAYVRNLAAMASGSGGSPDPFTPALSKAISQGWLSIAGADGGPNLGLDGQPSEDGRSPRRQAARPAKDG